MSEFIDIRYFGIDFTEIRCAKIESFDLEHLKLKRQEQTGNRIDQTGITTYLYDEASERNVEVSYLKILDNIKFNEFIFGVIWVAETKEIKPYVRIKTSIKYFECDGEVRGNNTKPLTMNEYIEFIHQIKEYLELEYKIKVNFDEVKFEQLEIAKLFTIKDRYCEYSPLLRAFYSLAPDRMKKLESDKRKKAHGLFDERDSEYGEYIETMKLGNASVGEIIYDKTTQLRKVYGLELEVDFMKVELKLKTDTQCDRAFDGKTIYQITDEDLEAYFIERIYKDIIKPYDEFLNGVDEDGRKKKLSLYKKLDKRAKSKRYKNDKGKYKSGWAKDFLLDVYSLEDKDTGLMLGSIVEVVLEVLKDKLGKNYKRTYKLLVESIDERPKTKGNLDRFAEIKIKLLY